MLKTIIEKEIRDLIGSTKFVFTFGVCAILIILAFYIGATRHKLYQNQYEASLSENLRAVEGITDWNELEGTKIFLPPQPLAALVSGVSNDIGRTASVEGRGEIIIEDSRYNEDPVFAIFRFIDLDFIFKVILSLFAMLLGFDSVSGEKERGTLRLSFANALPRHIYIIGKLTGTFLALTISITVAMAIGALLLPLMGIKLSGDEWLRLFIIIITGLLYFGVFLTMSFLVSSLTHRSANSFLILLVVWVLCIHIVPRISVLLAARSVDVPSVDEIAYQKSTLAGQLFNEFDDAMRSYDFSNATVNEDGDIIDGFNEYVDSLNEIRDTKMKTLASRLEEDRFNRQRVQEKLAFNLARFSPATSLSLALSYLAGSSLGLKNDFRDAANSYQSKFADFMTEKTGMNTGGFMRIRKTVSVDGEAQEAEQPESIDPREIPEFDFRSAGLAQSIQSSITDIGLLFILNFLFFAGAFIAFARYDVR